MKFIADIEVLQIKKILVSQWKTLNMRQNKFRICNFSYRIVQYYTLETDRTKAEKKVDITSKKLIANQIMEGYSFKIKQA